MGLSIIIIIAIIHIFRLGTYLDGNSYIFYYSYGADVLIPFGIYFLLGINELHVKVLRKWYVKAAVIVGFATLLEILQFFGIYALGTTFDPFDILSYAIGVGIAVFFDRYVFRKIIPNWDLKKE